MTIQTDAAPAAVAEVTVATTMVTQTNHGCAARRAVIPATLPPAGSNLAHERRASALAGFRRRRRSLRWSGLDERPGRDGEGEDGVRTGASSVGLALAVLAGMGFSIAAAMQKHEALRFDERPFRLLQRLAGRWLWLAAMVVDVGSWVAQATALALAPIAVAVPLMGLGTALLVALGVIALHERFTVGEILAIGLTVAGATGAAVASARLP